MGWRRNRSLQRCNREFRDDLHSFLAGVFVVHFAQNEIAIVSLSLRILISDDGPIRSA